MSSTPVDDYYSILGVARDASADEIKRSFRRLARECHPDVAGDDPATVARFTRIREAYETLSDPQKRDAYDNPPRSMAGGMFYRKRWRPPGGHHFDGLHHGDAGAPRRRAPASVRERLNDPNNNLGLEDIFSDLGSASSKQARTTSARRDRRAPDPRDTVRNVGEGLRDMMNNASAGPPGPDSGARHAPRAHTRHRREAPRGEDIRVTVDVPERVARSGGTVTVTYPRHKRGERSDTLFRYSEIHDLRVPSGVRDGHTLRVTKMGNAGAAGGAYGDLVCRLRLVRDTPPEAAAGTRTGAGTAAVAVDDDLIVPISLVEALLGGRVDVDTPGGRVRITVPAGSSSGTRMRLRGRGEQGTDLFVRLRIVVPRTLDDESRELIERFAALNPDSPRR